MTDTNTVLPAGARAGDGNSIEVPHHCAPQDIAALVARLEALGDPEQEAMPSFADTDWRTLTGVCARVINYLADLVAAPAVSAPAWQPIDTAPKDGAAILLLSDWGAQEAVWSTSRLEWVTGFEDAILEAGYQLARCPTHWMPVPAAPVFPCAVTAQGAAE